jgi:hypothetical protein
MSAPKTLPSPSQGRDFFIKSTIIGSVEDSVLNLRREIVAVDGKRLCRWYGVDRLFDIVTFSSSLQLLLLSPPAVRTHAATA